MTLRIEGSHFVDEKGRTRILRGVNLGGSSKVPTTPNGATYNIEGFFNHREVSFVGRPFPLEEADAHFQRLHRWGLTFLRFLVTWEAIEHAGPGQYDEAYLDYISAIIDKAGEYGMICFIDPHQDVWSRFTGGDGAPGWTLEAVGFEMRHFKATGAALVHQTHGDPFPKMQWASNYSKLACATMFSLFWAGNDFAPELTVDGQPVQDYLQSHFIGAMRQVALRMKDKPHVIGYDIFNEPSRGFIGCDDLGRLDADLRYGVMPTPFQAMLMGSGYSQLVDIWDITPIGPMRTDGLQIDPAGQTAWQDEQDCIWRKIGVWDVDEHGQPILLKPFHFATKPDGTSADFSRDYLRPFANRYAAAIREVDPSAIIFLEFDAMGNHPLPQWSEADADNIVFAPHWYDGLALLSKRYISWLGFNVHNLRPVVGYDRKRRSFIDQMAMYKQQAYQNFGGVPTVIGEIGIPFDMHNKEAFRSGDFRAQVRALDDSLQAVERNLLHATIWNYTADNNNTRGDLWNDEDLSLFSADQQKDSDDLDSGGRALQAAVRPYAIAVSGEARQMCFDIDTKVFEFEFMGADTTDEPTEFFVPNLQYPEGYGVHVSDGYVERDVEQQRLYYWHMGAGGRHIVRIRPLHPLQPHRPKNTQRYAILAALSVLMVIVWLSWQQRRKH